MKSQLKIVFFGTPQFVVPVLEKLAENFQVVGVVTAPDQKAGRKQLLTPSPVKLASQGQAWEANVLTPQKLDPTLAEQLTKIHPDLFVVAAYGKIIPQNILDIPKFGALNIHYSLLPKYRGASPIQEALLNGDKVSGTSIIKMDAKLDHGPIVSTKEIRLSESDNFESLNTIMTKETIPLLLKTIPDFMTGKIKLQVQDDTMATYCSIIKKEDGFFDINNSPPLEKLDRMIRAYYPWPTAWTKWPFDKAQGKNNKIVKLLPQNMVQIEGKKPVKLEEFLRGYPDFPIKTLAV
ncbi:MAG: methionyl-tRNA formyltransferase [bacterium]|nr:methionyl-tRNA formyltransferase [bacterium]